MRYLDLITGEIVEPKELKIRKGYKKDISDFKNSRIPSYAIEDEKTRYIMYSYSTTDLLIRFADNLTSITTPIELKIEFGYDNKLYPNDDPKYGIETIANMHNKLTSRYCKKIVDNPNPFSQRVSDELTPGEAGVLARQIKKIK
jgi:hypothetical protein